MTQMSTWMVAALAVLRVALISAGLLAIPHLWEWATA